MKTTLQKILPRYSLTRIFGLLGECKVKWFKNFFIQRFIKLYKIDLSESVIKDYKEFDCFNTFFSRKLVLGARPIDVDGKAVVSPVDGYIYDFGSIADKPMFSAKGFEFSLEDLVVKKTVADLVREGSFLCMYLSPKDYHRVQMPLSGRLVE